MGFIQLPGGLPDTTKMFLSFWFRMPIDNSGTGSLMSFGAPQPIWQTDLTLTPHLISGVFILQTLDDVGVPYHNEQTGHGCYVGFDGNGDGTVSLRVNIQLADMPTYTKSAIYADSFTLDTFDQTTGFAHADQFGSWNSTLNVGIGVQNTGWNFAGYHATIADFSSSIVSGAPPLLRIESPIRLSPGQWHHVLLAIDISDGLHCHGSPTFDTFATASEGYDSTWKVWYALDDTNYNGAVNLAPYFIDGSSDLNAVSNPQANSIATSATSPPRYNNDVSGPPAYDSSAAIPASIAALGIPANAAFAGDIGIIQMAELQLFTGVSADTSNLTVRRAFVTEDGYPADPALAEACLGKTPEIKLRGFANWVAGINTGTAGPLDPTGTITRYTPGPRIGA